MIELRSQQPLDGEEKTDRETVSNEGFDAMKFTIVDRYTLRG